MDSQGGLASGGVGVLGAIVWPTHLGAVTGHPGPGPKPANEPTDSPDYERGQIEWMLETSGPFAGEIVGRALLNVPAGVYEYLVFCHGPGSLPKMINATKFEHPLVYEKAGVMEVYPIRNNAV